MKSKQELLVLTRQNHNNMRSPGIAWIIFALVSYFVIPPCLTYTAFIFGDSLVDAGNNNYLVTLSKADTPPYGIDFAASGGQPTGRFTNGRTIADIIGEALGAESLIPPYLAPGASSNAFSTGTNYASGASGILDYTGTIFIGRVPLDMQVGHFERTRESMVNSLGQNTTMSLLKNAIFSLTTGSNDVVNYFNPTVQFSDGYVSPEQFQDFMVSNMTMQLKRLHGLGARKFVLVGIGPLGCIPFFRAVNLVRVGECSDAVNSFVAGFNEKLEAGVRQMNVEMGSDSIIVYANSYDIFNEIVANYRSNGFDNFDGPCCGGSVPPLLCYQEKGTRDGSPLCDDRTKYVFWDAYHPTEAANLIIADRLLNGNGSYCFPMNVRELYDYEFQ